MKSWWSIPIFAVGLLVGVAIGHRSGGGETTSASATTSEAPSRRAPHGGRTVEHEAKWRSLARTAGNLSDEERRKLVDGVKPTDRISALEALAGQTGPDGLDQELQSMMSNILSKWAEEDFEGAWKWSEHCEPAKFQSFVKRELLGELLETDPARSLELHAEQVKRDPSFTSRVSGQFIEKMAMKDADGLVDVLSKFSFQMSRVGSHIKFAEDFDFRKAADGMTALVGGKKDYWPHEFPANFAEEWAKRDPEGAHQWLMKGGKLPFGGWSDVYETLEISRGTKEAGDWAAHQIEQAGEYRANLINGLDGIPRNRAESTIRAITDAMPDAESRDRFLQDVVSENPYSLEGVGGAAISGLSSPEARLDAFRKMHEKGAAIDLDDISAAKFQAWGITREQVQEIVKE